MRLRIESDRNGKEKYCLKSNWLELHFRFAKPRLTLDVAGYFDERPMLNFNVSYLLLLFTIPLFYSLSISPLIAIPIVLLQLFFGYGEAFISLPIRTGINDCESPRYGFYFYGEGKSRMFFDTVVICKGEKHKHIPMPWQYDWVRTSLLLADGTWAHEVTGDRRDFWTLEWVAKRWSEQHPYCYQLKSGEVQNVTATIFREDREWRPRWFKWTSLFAKIRKSIEIEFSNEVGEQAGSWKGGTIGCSYELKPSETPVDSLKRMELERTFR